MGTRIDVERTLVSITLLAVVMSEAMGKSPPAITAIQIEKDWLRQDVVRHMPPNSVSASGGTVGTQQDAAGGCDGIKDGTYGFHTSREAEPWWQVDLGESIALDRIDIFNRCDGGVGNRATRLIVLFSGDGKQWKEIYRHDGSLFRGTTDGEPLTVSAGGAAARFVRIQLPDAEYLHLDETEVYPVGGEKNIALHKLADQSSCSPWSIDNTAPSQVVPTPEYHIAETIERGLNLANDLAQRGVDVVAETKDLQQINAIVSQTAEMALEAKQAHYVRARRVIRDLAMKNPLLDFDDLLLVKRVPGVFTHMSDQYYGWFSRPGGGLYVLQGFKTDEPKLRCLTESMPTGSIVRPDISFDGKRVLFAHCRHYPGLSEEPNKLDKANVPEDAFYHLYEMNLDGTGLRRLTQGKYDNFDGRYLPDGRIVFLSTRRGQYVQCTSATAAASFDGAQPDCYVRCGGGPERPVAVYTLHVIDSDGQNLQQISPFEMFEWTPSVDQQGRILYSRWDYVDRHNMPYMSLWSTMPDGTRSQAIFGNFTRNPHCVFEARSIPGSGKLIFTASGHHAMTGGSLVLLDPKAGADGETPMTRLTPEVCFPESEGWPSTYFVNPYPLSEEHYLVAWSASPQPPGTPRPRWGMPGPPNDLGVYLFDAFGNLNLLYRDPVISSMYPLPIRARRRPPTIASKTDPDGTQEGRVLLIDVSRGLQTQKTSPVRALRLVGVPAKTHPTMNFPNMGVTSDDPGKFVMGTVPVENDGSAYFRVPSGVTFFVQALDSAGMAVQTMRSATYVQPGEQATCVGCHEPRNTAPPNILPVAARREPSRIELGPEGSWPLDFQALVQPVLQQHCVECHRPSAEGAKFDLTAERSYDSLVDYGSPSLRSHVQRRYNEGRSTAGACAARTNPLWRLLDAGHYNVELGAGDRQRLIIWMDTYGQRRGSFDATQEERLRELRREMTRAKSGQD